jgi:hypothetical protein
VACSGGTGAAGYHPQRTALNDRGPWRTEHPVSGVCGEMVADCLGGAGTPAGRRRRRSLDGCIEPVRHPAGILPGPAAVLALPGPLVTRLVTIRSERS